MIQRSTQIIILLVEVMLSNIQQFAKYCNLGRDSSSDISTAVASMAMQSNKSSTMRIQSPEASFAHLGGIYLILCSKTSFGTDNRQIYRY